MHNISVLYCAHLCMKCSLGISNFLGEISLVFPILLFSSISLHWSLRKTFISLLFFGTAFRWLYLSFSHFPFTSIIFSAICKASSDSNFTIWWCPCVESCLGLLEEGVCYDQCVLLTKLLTFAPLHFVLQGQTCLLLQVISWLTTLAFQFPMMKKTSFVGVSCRRSYRSS